MIVFGNTASSMSTKSAMTTLTGDHIPAVELPGIGGPGENSANAGST